LKQNKNSIYYIILSITAAVLLLILTFLSPLNTTAIGIYDKLLVSGIFITSCIFGISLALYPRWFRRLNKHTTPHSNNKKSKQTARKYKGHHPDCSNFHNHTIVTKNKILCAGCLGLSIGSIVSIVLTIIYLSITREKTVTGFYYIIVIGLIIIGLAYVEIMLPIRHAAVHTISNIFLVLSFLLVTISLFEITGNKIYGILGVIISFLFLDTRIQLSNWKHARICESCSETCKMY
jgi:hypothetical protein